MRTPLERMARVDRYLLGEMNQHERTLFIQDMKTDNDLKQDHDFQQALITSMQLEQAKANIRKASRAYHYKKIMLNALLALIGIAGISAAIYFGTKDEIHVQTDAQQTPVEQTVFQHESATTMTDTTAFSEEESTRHPQPTSSLNVRDRIAPKETKQTSPLPFDSTANRPPLLTAVDVYEDDKHFCTPKKVASQFYEIDIDRDTTIITSGGSRITYNKGSLMTDAGKVVHGKAILEFKEFTSLENMILGGMSTTSDGKILQTGGMFYINAVTVNATPLKIKPGKEILVDIPTNGGYDDMQYFTGVENNIDTRTVIEEPSELTDSEIFMQKKGAINWVDPRPISNYAPYLGITADTTYTNGLKRSRKDGSVVDEKVSFWDVLFPKRLRKRYFYEQVPVPKTTIYSNRNAGISSYTMQVLNFGWANCDRFMGDRNAIMATMKVNIIEDSLDAPYNVQLILPRESIIIQGYETGKDQFNFGKDTFKLPNDAFYVILVSMEFGDQIYYSYAVGNVRTKNIVPILCKPAEKSEYFKFVKEIAQLENISS